MINPGKLQNVDATRVEVFGYIFVRNAVNAVYFCKNCDDCGECGENKYFTAFHRISYKNSPHQLLWQNNVRNAVKAVNAVKKIIHHI